MSLTTKILIWVGALAVVGALSFIIYNQINISKQQQAIQQQVLQQKALVDGLVQSANSYTTKDDLNKWIQQNTGDLKAIQSNLSQLGAQITAANVVTVDSQGQSATNVPSTGKGPANPTPPSPTVVNCPNGGSVTCPNTDQFGYQQATQQLALNEDFTNMQVPFGTVGFSAWLQHPWSISIKPREYHVTNVVGTDENQRVYIDNKFSIQVDGKTYTTPIALDKTEQVYPQAKWYWWNPLVFAGLDGGLSINQFPQVQGEFAPSLNLGVMSYGKFKTQPDFSVLQVGAGYATVSSRPIFSVTPVAVNLGTVLPLVHNTYLAPSLQLDTKGVAYGMIGLRLGL